MKIVVIACLLGALATTSHADPSDAERLYAEGQAAYDRHDYALAIRRWQAAYQLSPLPLLVLNLAQAYRLAGDCEHALASYRRYVGLEPASEQRALADGFIAELEPTCGTPAPPRPRPEPPVARERRARGRGWKVAGLTTGGAGVAIVATGLLFGARASSLGHEVTRDCSTSCDWAVERSKQSAGKRDAAIGEVLDGIGVAAVAAGIGMYIYGARGGKPELTVRPVPNGAAMSWSGRW